MKLESWSETHRALVRKMPAIRPMPEDDFAVFWARCVQSGLDPLLDQCHAVARQTKTTEPELDSNGQLVKEQGSNGKWYTVYKRITTYQFQATESGMLARALSFPDCMGVQAGAVFEDDHFVLDKANGKVEHVAEPTKRKGKLVGAWGRTIRDGKIPDVVWLRVEAMNQGGDFWAKMPDVMVEKTARAASIRKAYPSAFSGVYIAEEMPTEEREEQLAAIQSPISGTRKVDAPNVAPATQGPPVDVEEALRAEVDSICAEAENLGPGTVKTHADAYKSLHARAVALPKGSAARTRVAKVMGEASKRMAQPPPVVPDAALADAELSADAFCADVEGLELTDAEGYQRLRARAEKMPEGAARARCMAALDAVKAKLEGVK